MESCEEKQKWIQEVTASIGWGLWTLKTEAEHREDEEPLDVATTLDLVDASVFCTAGLRGMPSSNKGQINLMHLPEEVLLIILSFVPYHEVA